MRKGTYAIYKGIEFSATNIGNGNFLLVSNDIKDLKYGFKPSTRNKGYYIKTVAQSDLDEVYDVLPKAVYQGDEFQALEVKKNGVEISGRILLVTPNKDIGDKHGFGMRDFGMYTKEVGIDEIDQLIEIKEPYPNS
jgi:hypothetical protein